MNLFDCYFQKIDPVDNLIGYRSYQGCRGLIVMVNLKAKWLERL